MLSSCATLRQASLLQLSAAALSLLRDVQLPAAAWSRARSSRTTTRSASGQGGVADSSGPPTSTHHAPAQSSWACLHSFSSPGMRAGLHHAAAVDALGASDDDQPAGSTSGRSSREQRPRSSPPWQDNQRQPKQQQQQQRQHLHHMAGHHNTQDHHQHVVQHTPRYQGHLHVPHGRRHATSHSQVDRFISEQLLSCKSLGMLRRIMIKHKATMEPEHVSDTVLCLQHLVRVARAANKAGVRPGLAYMHHATSQARSQPRVRAAGEFSRSKLRASDSDGHMEQLVAQMLGELGNMIWFMMGDMTGPDLAKVLYSWATLEWHPEPELLADVKASFIAAAAGGGLQQQQQQNSSKASSQQQHQQQQQQQPGEQQWAELEAWQGPWMAAGLWGLVRMGEPCEGRVLQLLQQHWQQLMRYWTPQQMADVAGGLSLTADSHVAAAALGQQQHERGQEEQQLAHMVMSLAQQTLVVLGGDGSSREDGSELLVPLPWPESMLIQLQAALGNTSVPAAQRAAAAASSAASSAAAVAVPDGVPMMPVNVQNVAWRMLQALASVGVDVSEPEDAATAAVVAALSAATKGAVGVDSMQ